MPERTCCKTCATKWGKSLWSGSCACTGDVDLVFRMPGNLSDPAFVIIEKPIVPKPPSDLVIDHRIAFKARRGGRR